MLFRSLNRLGSEAKLTVLKSGQGSDNNSLDNPRIIVPVASRVPVSGNSFAHEFPAYSFTVMRFAAKGGAAPIKKTNVK